MADQVPFPALRRASPRPRAAACLSVDRLDSRRAVGTPTLCRGLVVVRSSVVFPESDSLKLHSLILKTKSLGPKTRVSLKQDSLTLKTKPRSLRTRESLKQDSIILKTKSIVFRTRASLKLHSLVLKTPVNISAKDTGFCIQPDQYHTV